MEEVNNTPSSITVPVFYISTLQGMQGPYAEELCPAGERKTRNVYLTLTRRRSKLRKGWISHEVTFQVEQGEEFPELRFPHLWGMAQKEYGDVYRSFLPVGKVMLTEEHEGIRVVFYRQHTFTSYSNTTWSGEDGAFIPCNQYTENDVRNEYIFSVLLPIPDDGLGRNTLL